MAYKPNQEAKLIHNIPYENSKMVILSFFIKFGICINLTIRNFPIFWLWEEEKGRGKFMNILTIFIGSKFLEVNSLSQELGKFQPVWYIQIKVAGYKFLFFCCFLCLNNGKSLYPSRKNLFRRTVLWCDPPWYRY